MPEERLKSENWSLDGPDEEKKDRLLGFFQLLYEIDRHNHPELYETQHKENV